MNSNNSNNNNKPSQEWKASLNSTLNRLSNQYLTLLRAASSEMALDEAQVDHRGEYMNESVSESVSESVIACS